MVRDNTRGRKTLYLDYEAYREMALEQMESIRNEALSELRDLLNSLQKSDSCDTASTTLPLSQEEKREIAPEVHSSPTEFNAARSHPGGTSSGPAERTRSCSGRAARQRRRSRRARRRSG